MWVVGALLTYTAGMLVWLAGVVHLARLEADVFGRFVRLSGWPDRVSAIGLVWTALLAGCVLVLRRAHGRGQLVGLAATTTAMVTTGLLVPALFKTMGQMGISTSEFTDALLPLLGGVAGEATVGLWTASAAFIVWTLIGVLGRFARVLADR